MVKLGNLELCWAFEYKPLTLIIPKKDGQVQQITD